MKLVADVVADTNRRELAGILNMRKIQHKFVFFNLAHPMATGRYVTDSQLHSQGAEGLFAKTPKQLEQLEVGVNLFNTQLCRHTTENGDILIDITKIINPKATKQWIEQKSSDPARPYRITKTKSKNEYALSGGAMDWTGLTSIEQSQHTRMTEKATKGKYAKSRALVTADGVHPTAEGYEQIWKHAQNTLTSNGISIINPKLKKD